MARVANIIKILAGHHIPLTDSLLSEAYDWSVENDADVKGMTRDEYGEMLVVGISTRR